MKPFNATHFLVYYSAVVTAAFVFTVWHGVKMEAAQTAGRDWSHADFDQLTVHRINIVEPDGTPRMIIRTGRCFPASFRTERKGRDQTARIPPG